eukprot:scaffold139628_cov55-Cyclotella_meneghiniana.AAC.1
MSYSARRYMDVCAMSGYEGFFPFQMKFGSSILDFTPRWSMFGLIKEYHSISTLPASHYKYNEWLDKVEIAVWALKW